MSPLHTALLLCLPIAGLARHLTANERERLLNFHNHLRRDVANGRVNDGKGAALPAARDMNRLSWSSRLAHSSAKHAKLCTYEHSSGRPENLAMHSMRGINLTEVASMWMTELDGNALHGVCSMKPNRILGHYTQLVWARATQVGCGVAECPRWGTYLVCQYDKGNLLHTRVYTAGEPCSACANTCDKGLCTKPAFVKHSLPCEETWLVNELEENIVTRGERRWEPAEQPTTTSKSTRKWNTYKTTRWTRQPTTRPTPRSTTTSRDKTTTQVPRSTRLPFTAHPRILQIIDRLQKQSANVKCHVGVDGLSYKCESYSYRTLG